ncbi:MAG: ATP-binding domain-containing protein [Actinomycetota bacterium]
MTGADTDHPTHPDLPAEQAWLDAAHRHLQAMQRRVTATREASDRAVRDENTVDAKVAQYHLRRREEDLHRATGPLCFGRIDTDEAERHYIGRRHIEDDNAQPVMIDWRAPVSAAFYRATAVDPCGLDHRRRFSVIEQEIVSIFDEDLTDPESLGASGLPDPLLAELERSRTGQMRDIVSTIAAEQDVIIRAPLAELLVVQGGPGTGKTAVGLHRAAFLLFQHRETLIEREVLVLGPNPLFLRYIAEVLPSLGETSVRQATVSGLLAAKYRVRAVDEAPVARIKGDARMAAVIEAAIRDRIRVPADGLEVRSGLAVVRFSADDLDAMVKTVLSRRLPVNQGRDVFRQMVVAESWRRHAARLDTDPGTEPVFTSGIRGDKGFKTAIDKMWPNLTAAVIIRGLFGSARRLASAADGILDRDEQAALKRTSARKPADEPWTDADLPLLDEAEARLSGVPARYGHVVVDEAQDLSAMALRLVGRRTERGSMTVLGDLAQATALHAPGSWDVAVGALLDGLGEVDGEVEVHHTELTVGYRVPAAILDVANRLLPHAAPTVTPAVSVRLGGEPPLVLATDEAGLAAAVVSEVRAAAERTASVAVVAVDQAMPAIEAAMVEAGVAVDRVGRSGLPGRDAVAIVSPLAVKGLEFDAVVVVEPAAIAQLEHGLRHLYVAMTRAVKHLGIVHAGPLPPELGDPDIW